MTLIVLRIICFTLCIGLNFSLTAQHKGTTIDKNTTLEKNQTTSPPLPADLLYGPVEQQPRFPGCEDRNLDNRELEYCSKDALRLYISTNLVYPESAKKESKEGYAFVQFQIDKNGVMDSIEVMRDKTGYFCEAALKLIEKMQTEIIWIPGIQRGTPVRVRYILPIKFEL